MSKLKLEKTYEYSDQLGFWIVCKDSRGLEWTVRPEVFDTFKYTGFPFLNPEAELKINELMQKEWINLPQKERFDFIKTVIEIATNKPIEEIFPNI